MSTLSGCFLSIARSIPLTETSHFRVAGRTTAPARLVAGNSVAASVQPVGVSASQLVATAHGEIHWTAAFLSMIGIGLGPTAHDWPGVIKEVNARYHHG